MRGRASRLQGYLTHTKTHPPRTPYRRPVPRVLGWSRGLGVFSGARYPCSDFCRCVGCLDDEMIGGGWRVAAEAGALGSGRARGLLWLV